MCVHPKHVQVVENPSDDEYDLDLSVKYSEAEDGGDANNKADDKEGEIFFQTDW